MADLLSSDLTTQLAAVITLVLMVTSSRYVKNLGKSEAELKMDQHRDRLHFHLWRYSRDGQKTANMLRIR